MKKLNVLKSLIAVFILIPAVLVCQVPDIKLSAKLKAGEPDYSKISGRNILYEQMSNPSNEGISSQDFPDFPNYSCQGADDFIVPAGETWTIESIMVLGLYSEGGGIAESVNVSIYENDPLLNLPGAIVSEYFNLPVVSTVSGDLTIELNMPLRNTTLNEGQYWVSVQVFMSYTEFGQWFWRKQLEPTILNEMAWRNPGGGWQIPGGENWQSGSVIWPESVNHNLSFGLYGSATSFGEDFIKAGQDLWTVPCGIFTFGENGDYPALPTDFFGPGSDPFDGLIELKGENSDGSQIPFSDLIVQRITDGYFSEPLPSFIDVPIEIIDLRLKSSEPIQVNFNGVPDSFFDVFVEINFTAGTGGVDIIAKEYPLGGAFTKDFYYYPVITFKEVGNPGNQFVFNPFDLGLSSLVYESIESYPWTLSPINGEFDPIGDNSMILFSNSGSYLQLIPLLKRYDHSFLDMSEMGFPVAWGGSGYNEGEWFYYPNTNWWNVWFYDHPVAPDRRKIIDGMLIIQPRMPDFPTYVEIVFNWSTPAWPGFPEMDRPPLPFDVQDPIMEEMMIVRSQPLIVFQGNLFEPIMVPVPFEILEYNPEWLSIDLRGSNFILMADLQHTCWKEGDCGEFGYDFGDAPESSLAYINGTIGQFPTCMNTGSAGSFISHAQPSGLFFGGMVDVEIEGNAGTCPMFHPNNYNVDECGTFPYPLPPPNWLDEGLMFPVPLTIVGTAGNEQYLPCGQQTMALGSACGLATWGQNLDIWVDASQSQGGYLNVLFDWDQNGVWMGASSCQPPINPNDYVPEHAVLNLQIPAGFVGPVSQLNPTYGFQIGPNPGYVWARFSLTDMPVPIEWDGSGVFAYGETEDYLIEISGNAQGNLDFGDAPQPYPTLLANDGARHVIDGVTFLGLSVDAEPDGQPDPNALGDDNNGGFDEDGVFWGMATPGSAAPLHVITSVAGFLQGWIDFNADGDWSDPGEQIFTDEYIHFGGTHCLNYFVPANAKVGNTFARFRFSTQPGLTYTSLAPDGEVEDYMIEIIENSELKWIQEPCPYLPGLHAHDYTIQGVYTRITLADDWICNGGAVTKIQWWGNYEVDANGNEMRFQGISHFHLGIHAHSPNGCLPVNPEIWGADVSFSISNEQFIGVHNSEAGNIYSYEYVLPEPFNQIEGTQYWLAITAVSVDPVLHPRWRWQESDRSTSTVLCPTVNKWTGSPWSHISWSTPPPVRFSEMAFALISEYIDEYDFGDAPDQPYPTLLVNDGARHKIVPTVFLGNLIDAEPDGQPTANAVGDDLNNLDDEDGVTIPRPLVVGKTATIKVKASVAGYLNAWIDFNKNGTWADAGDQIFLDQPLVAGINNLTFNVPAGIKAGPTYARFRFNTTGGLNYYGPAEDGEVEDYRLIIHPPNWGYNPTGSTHLIAIPANVAFDCISLTTNDFIGAFYIDDGGDEVCGGAIMWDGLNNQAVIAYVDDQTTPEKDGFDENESFIWKVYHSTPDVEENVVVSYDLTLPDIDGKFHSNGLSGLTAIKKPWYISATATPDTICAGETVQLQATVTGGCGTFIYAWSSIPVGFSSNFQNPSDNPVVTTTYQVMVTNSFGDSKTASVLVVVHPLPQMDCPPYMIACEDDPPVKLNTAYPQGGIYTGTGVFFNAGSYWFDPSVGPGTYLITYCFTDPVTGCTDCCEFNFIVHPKPDVECPDDFTVCIDTDPFDLTGATPPGGNYTGNGVSGGKFYPAVAGEGDHVITYTYTDPQTFCTNSCEFVITVIVVEVECPDDFALCLNDDPVTLTGGTPSGGTYAGPGVSGGVFYPAIAGVGVHVLTYTWVYPGTNCSATCEFIIEVYPLPQMDCPPYMMACEDDLPVKLNTAYPQGGIYTGTGVFFNAGSYWFDPSVGPGTYLITYCFTDPLTSCTNCCEFNFIVHPKPVVECPDDFTVCNDTDPFDLTGATPPGGNYSGNGVSGGKFYPAIAGAGDHVITYTYTDPQTLCANSCEFVITVIVVEVECPDDFALCLNDDPVTLTGATPTGGIYTGPGVNSGVFYPALAGMGDHIITYTYNLPGTNCNGTCEFIITVLPIPQMDCPADFSVCLNSPLILLDNAYPPGGEYSGTGIIFNGGLYYFDPSIGIGSYLITYCFTDSGTGCTNCCEFEITVVADHLIGIPEGWSGISSYIVPIDPLLDNMLYPIMNELIILQNLTGVYWPGQMNTLITWNEYSGYAIKVNDDTGLPVCGNEIINKTLNLNAGWNTIPVLSSIPVDIAILFSSVNGFQIAKEVAGYGIYWPMFGINTIGNVMPGKAYYVRMTAPGTIDYSMPAAKSPDVSINLDELSTPWNKVTNTPGSHLVAFNLNSSPFTAGDIIGGFTSEGVCTGLALIEHDQPFAISLNGNDPYGNEKVGFENSELLTFKVYRPSTGEEFMLAVDYSPEFNTGEFENNGISVIISAKLSSTSVSEPVSSSIELYPNPSNGIFTIAGVAENVNVQLYSNWGGEIFNQDVQLPANIDISDHPKGIYLIKITTSHDVIIKKLVIN